MKYVNGGLSFIDAAVEYAERKGIEVEVVADIIKSSEQMTAHLRRDAERLNMVAKSSTRPLYDD
jgi:hypothetical protein